MPVSNAHWQSALGRFQAGKLVIARGGQPDLEMTTQGVAEPGTPKFALLAREKQSESNLSVNTHHVGPKSVLRS